MELYGACGASSAPCGGVHHILSTHNSGTLWKRYRKLTDHGNACRQLRCVSVHYCALRKCCGNLLFLGPWTKFLNNQMSVRAWLSFCTIYWKTPAIEFVAFACFWPFPTVLQTSTSDPHSSVFVTPCVQPPTTKSNHRQINSRPMRRGCSPLCPEVSKKDTSLHETQTVGSLIVMYISVTSITTTASLSHHVVRLRRITDVSVENVISLPGSQS